MGLEEQSMKKVALSAALAASFAVSACATNPVSGRPDLVFSSEESEVKRAKQRDAIGPPGQRGSDDRVARRGAGDHQE